MPKPKSGRHRSALKELRKSIKRRAKNLILKNKIKEIRKNILKAINDKNFEEVKKLLPLFYKIVDKAQKTHYIHKNKAARLKSTIAKKLSKLGII
ncbi:MAG: 30S ribosomal protein S20 [Endomicrobia bacterium]|nr:30S ribosomal protein S20 [Endomicrobiia bacterium]MCX7715990.1 30S ribosomal protein S20 [Endomicrobiia bacterium]